MTITLSDWFYEWVTATGGVLSIHEDYFLLTGGIERWLYPWRASMAATRTWDGP